jgi:menaquinone-specific isochorismate synthase
MNAADLIARTAELDPAGPEDLDLLALAGDNGMLFEREGVGFACHGQAGLLELPNGLGEPGAAEQVVAQLAGIESEGDLGLPGSGAMAIGALPFDRRAPGMLVIPALTLGVSAAGTAWRTTVSPRDDPDPATPATSAPTGPNDPWPPDHFTLSSPCPHEEWCEMLARALKHVESGQLHKVVLAREVLVEANRDFFASDILGRLRALYPSCTIFSIGGFVGASPELLVSRRGQAVRSHPHAGTVARSGDPATDDALIAGLMDSPKQRREHRAVVEAVAGALRPLCRQLDVPTSPSIVLLRNVSHLATLIQGELSDGNLSRSALGLAARLHPTPAVAGSPTDAALKLIADLEGMDRGCYAGPVGWVDARGDGDWVVGIRSATLDGPTARLVAGVGVVTGSDPRDELAETQLKLQALLAAVVRP